MLFKIIIIKARKLGQTSLNNLVVTINVAEFVSYVRLLVYFVKFKVFIYYFLKIITANKIITIYVSDKY